MKKCATAHQTADSIPRFAQKYPVTSENNIFYENAFPLTVNMKYLIPFWSSTNVFFWTLSAILDRSVSGLKRWVREVSVETRTLGLRLCSGTNGMALKRMEQWGASSPLRGLFVRPHSRPALIGQFTVTVAEGQCPTGQASEP